jgi:hypothetical protein
MNEFRDMARRLEYLAAMITVAAEQTPDVAEPLTALSRRLSDIARQLADIDRELTALLPPSPLPPGIIIDAA